jgi:FAD/FMN-containing dehydrogenase
MIASELAGNGLDQLCRLLPGRVVRRGDEGYDQARRAWQLRADLYPEAVVYPERADDVALAVTFASAHGLRIAAQSTGHGASPLGFLDGALLLKTERMRTVTVDPGRRRARAQAGARWQDVSGPAAAYGLAGLAGSAPDVGVVGYTLGGGVGFLGRRYGLSSNSVAAIELVTGDGRLRRVDADHDADLFWALRGGGGSFGVVTAIELQLHPVPEVYAGGLFWPLEAAREVLGAWRAWIRDVPDQVTSLWRIRRFPPRPEIAEPLRGRAFTVIEAAAVGDMALSAELLQPLRALGPELDTFRAMSPADLAQVHMDPPGPVAGIGNGMLLDSLPGEALDALVRESGEALVSVEVRHLGGALSRAPLGHGALGRLEAPFALHAVGAAPTPAHAVAAASDLARLEEALEPFNAGPGLLNLSERPTEPGQLFSGEVLAKLRAVRNRHDPRRLFLANHPL